MAKMIDPPSGWRYGFPKELPKEIKPGGINDWLISEGYPKEVIDDLGEYFHYRMWEKPDEEIKPKTERITWDAAKNQNEQNEQTHTKSCNNPVLHQCPYVCTISFCDCKEGECKSKNGKQLKSLEQHNSERSSQVFSFYDMNKPQKNGIACPTCGEELWDSNPMVTLTSFPAQKNIHCEKCKYSGYRIA